METTYEAWKEARRKGETTLDYYGWCHHLRIIEQWNDTLTNERAKLDKIHTQAGTVPSHLPRAMNQNLKRTYR